MIGDANLDTHNLLKHSTNTDSGRRITIIGRMHRQG